MRWIDQAGIGQGQQLATQRIVKQVAKVGCGPAERDAQIRTADIADKQRVAGQDGVRFILTAIEVEDGD